MQIIHFNEMDVEVAELSKNSWRAWQHATAFPIGAGSTMMEAIVDLRDKLKDSE